MNKHILMIFVLALLLVQNVSGQRVDSDSDGILDEFDMCPNTSPREDLPVFLNNLEFVGCSCSQIFDLMEGEYCLDIYCMPNKALSIRERELSSRSNPCPNSECRGSDLVKFELKDPIKCVNGREMDYECEEVIVENSSVCVENDGLVNNNSNTYLDADSVASSDDSRMSNDYVFDLIVKSYRDKSLFAELLRLRNISELSRVEENVLSKVDVERVVDLEERIINGQSVVVADVSLIVTPPQYFDVEDFILIEAIKGDISSRNVVINDELFFDEENQLIAWNVDSLKNKIIFEYRITPGDDLDFDFVVQGSVKSLLFKQLILPVLLLIVIVGFVVFWFINMREKNNVFKS